MGFLSGLLGNTCVSAEQKPDSKNALFAQKKSVPKQKNKKKLFEIVFCII